jgi:hypothetical protein
VEYTKDGETFGYLRPLPFNSSVRCQAVLADGNVFLAKSAPNGVYLYEMATEQWSSLEADMPIDAYGYKCGVIKGNEIVVSGGRSDDIFFDNVEIYSVEDGKWRSGIHLPSVKSKWF